MPEPQLALDTLGEPLLWHPLAGEKIAPSTEERDSRDDLLIHRGCSWRCRIDPLLRLLQAHPRITHIVAHGGNAHLLTRRFVQKKRHAVFADHRDIQVHAVFHTSRRDFNQLSRLRRGQEFHRMVVARRWGGAP